MGTRFNESTISDQKRFVRGEHWLLARTLLRKRDEKHHEKWRILILAGGSPAGEINAIHEVMPKAHIVAMDIDQQCLSAAIDSGANDVILCDVFSATRLPGKSSVVPGIMDGQDLFDVVNLDLCGPVSSDLSRAIGRYISGALMARGVLMVTFSYGRDVAEMFLDRDRKFEVPTGHYSEVEERELPVEMPDNLAGRVSYLGHLKHIESIMAYKGNEMPMCSILYQKGFSKEDFRRRRPRFAKIGPDDLGLAVAYPDAANLYDCPAERIRAFRNHFSAKIAVAARQARTKAEEQLPLFSQAE